VKIGPLSKRRKRNNSSRDVIYEKTERYAWTDYKTNTRTAKELNITSLLDRVQEYIRDWWQHTNRMACSRLPRILKKPTGRRTGGIIKETSRSVSLELVNK
jgi:hypothetical protein